MTTLIGPQFTNALSSSENFGSGKGFRLGSRSQDASGNEYMFVKAAATIAQYACVHISAGGGGAGGAVYLANEITAAFAILPGNIGFAQLALAADEYGWVLTRGAGRVKVAASCVEDVPLYTTDTAGVLDDATASASHHQIMTAMISTNTGTTATNCAMVAPFPSVRRPAP